MGDKADAAEEWKKVGIAVNRGADAIMDLSNSGKTRAFRQQVIDECPLMVGTVPMYDAIGYMEKPLIELTAEDLLEVLRVHAEDGVDFVTVHAGNQPLGGEDLQGDRPPHEHREPRRQPALWLDGGHRQREPLL